MFRIFVPVDSSRFEILVELFHLSLKLHNPLPQLVEIRSRYFGTGYLAGCQGSFDSSILYSHYVVCHASNVLIVRNHDDCLPQSPVYFDKEVSNHSCVDAVQLACGFIGEEQGRVVCQGCSYRYSLLLSTAKLIRFVILSVRESNYAQKLLCP